MTDMTKGPEQSGSSEQPESLDKILRQDASTNFSSIVHGALGETFRMVGLREQLNGNIKKGKRLEEVGDRIVLDANLSRMGINMRDLRGMVSREQDSGIVDGEVIEPRKELE